MCQVRLWKLASVSTGVPFWGTWGCSFLSAFERRVKFLFIRRIFIEEFKRHVREGSGSRQLTPKSPPLGNLKGVGLPGILRQMKEGCQYADLQLK
jgi:hypothetical protein